MKLPPRRAALYRLLLGLAAITSASFGLWAVLFPGRLVRLFELEPARHPSIWAFLGMVVGLNGALYASAAWRLHRAAPLVAIGLAGRILGPLGIIHLIASGAWPLRILPLVVFTDLVWWMPSGLFLLEGTRAGARVRALAPWAAAAVHVAAGLAMALVLRHGFDPDLTAAARAAYIVEHPVLWRGGWGLWMASAVSLLAFYAWWGAHLPARRLPLAAFVCAGVGAAIDLMCESLFLAWLPLHHDAIADLGRRLTTIFANGLYCVAGVTLTLATPGEAVGGALAARGLRGVLPRAPAPASAQPPGPRLGRALAVWTWAIWACGFAMVGAGVADSLFAIQVTTAALTILLCPWFVAMGLALGAWDGGAGST
ncbi:MAG: hypothetical protein HZA54_11640, partial [Planctomycetes bacterium]|nr:hypothetical protein [Planctomycetota bacterium]